MRRVVRDAIGTLPLRCAAELAGVSEGTLRNIIRGRDVRIGTVARIVEAHGYVLDVRSRKRQDVAVSRMDAPAD